MWEDLIGCYVDRSWYEFREFRSISRRWAVLLGHQSNVDSNLANTELLSSNTAQNTIKNASKHLRTHKTTRYRVFYVLYSSTSYKSGFTFCLVSKRDWARPITSQVHRSLDSSIFLFRKLVYPYDLTLSVDNSAWNTQNAVRTMSGGHVTELTNQTKRCAREVFGNFLFDSADNGEKCEEWLNERCQDAF